jgi:hypothetical protein
MNSKGTVLRTAACLVFSLATRHAAVAQPVAPLTAMDYIEIQQLVAKFSFTLDYCMNRGKDFADLFIDGGWYSIDPGNGKPPTLFATRERLEQLAGGPDCETVKPGPKETPPGRSHVRHLSQSLIIEAAPGGARGKSYAIYPAKDGKYLNPQSVGQLGFFLDEYVKTPNGWRFKSRVHQLAPPIG